MVTQAQQSAYPNPQALQRQVHNRQSGQITIAPLGAIAGNLSACSGDGPSIQYREDDNENGRDGDCLGGARDDGKVTFRESRCPDPGS